jgi:hypothetical protein
MANARISQVFQEDKDRFRCFSGKNPVLAARGRIGGGPVLNIRPGSGPARNSLAIAFGRAHGELSPLMKNYRAYAVWPNGSFEGYEALICVDDDEAIGAARRLADKSAIELWSGERFITRLEHKSK